jgi:thiamine-monophosphate kinase
MDEFTLIKDYFAPLTRGFAGSLNLADDAALLDVPPGQQLIVTKDAISEGVHFLGNENPALIARKLLRVNLSDLAAMGATPLCYFLALMLPGDTDSDWIEQFAEGLKTDQAEFSIHLAGGDTTATRGPLALSLTALGLVPQGQALLRRGAKAGDDIYVSGTIGDGALGLLSLQEKIIASEFLQQRYLLPQPRLALGEKLRNIANAAMDISDGLAQDLGHICTASSVGATIHRPLIPLSPAASGLVAANPELWNAILGGGDDYELLFTAAADKAPQIQSLGDKLNLPLTRIGEVTEGSGVSVLDETGNQIKLERRGYRHF